VEEIARSVLYPLFFRHTQAGRWRELALAARLMQLVALVLQPYFDPFFQFSSVLVMGLFWYLGALAVHWWVKRQWIVRGWWIGGAWALFLAFTLLPPFYGRNTIRQGIWAVVCTLIVGWLVAWEGRNQGKRDLAWSRLLRWCGDISYSLYAVHTPVILLVNWAFLVGAGRPSYAPQLVTNLVLPIAVAIAVHRFIETRFYRVRKAAEGETF